MMASPYQTETEIPPSHFGHFNEKGAANWFAPSLSPPANPGTAADWDWDLLQQISRRIQYRIRARSSGMKVGSRPVLHNAAHLMQEDHLLAAN
jgi:hypothetical protein